MKSYKITVENKDGTVQDLATCWPISSDIVVTAFHAVSIAGEWYSEIDQFEYWMTIDNAGTKVQIKPIASDIDADIALLKVITAHTDLIPLEIGEWGVSVGGNWHANGFPMNGGGKPLNLSGHITGKSKRVNSFQYDLLVMQGNGESMRGASGSPVEVEGLVVGMLITEIPKASVLLAIEIESVKRLIRIEEYTDLRERFYELVSVQPKAVLVNLAKKFKLFAENVVIKNDLQLIHSIVNNGFLYGPKRLFSILESLNESEDCLSLMNDYASILVQPELKRWPKHHSPNNNSWTRNVGHGIPKSLSQCWTSFLSSPRWDKLVQILVSDIGQNLAKVGANLRLIRRYTHFNFSTSFKKIRDELDFLIAETLKEIENNESFRHLTKISLQDLNNNLRRLKEHIAKDNSSNICLFVMGSSGSGKTHFLEELINDQVLHSDQTLILPIEWPSENHITTRMLDGAVLSGLQNATGRRFDRLAEFQSELDRLSDSESAFLSNLGITKGKNRFNLVIAFDDMQDAMPSHQVSEKLCLALHELIDNATQYTSLRWLVMMRDTSYDRLVNPIGQKSFWEEYGHSTIDSTKAGWIDLDLICRKDQVGWGILSQCFGETWAENQSEAMKNRPRRNNIALSYYIELPWFSWVLRNMGESWCTDALKTGDLNHLDMVKHLIEIKINSQGSTNDERNQINRYMRTIAAALMSSDGQREKDQNLINDVERFTTEAKYSFDSKDLSIEIQRLIDVSLLKQVTKDLVERLEVRLVMIWGYVGAEYLKNVINFLDSKATTKRLHVDLGNKSGDGLYYKESVLEFLLMIADLEDSDLVNNLLSLTPRNIGTTLVAVLFAAPKLSVKLQRRLYKYILNQQRTTLIGNYQKRELLAMMMFSERSSSDALSPSERINILQSEYLKIFTFGYSGYFLSVTNRIISNVTDTHELERCMKLLNGCELVGVVSALAQHVVTQLFLLESSKNNETKFKTMTSMIIRYAKHSKENVEIDDEDYRNNPIFQLHRTGSQTLTKYNFFTLHVLREFCDLLVKELGPIATFHLLESHNWFTEISTRYLVGRALVEQAHASIGRYFHNKSYLFRNSKNDIGAEFIQLIGNLVSSSTTNKRLQAMYLMRHTRPTHGEKHVKIHTCFIRHLKLLSMDDNINTKADFIGVYKATLGVDVPNRGKKLDVKKRFNANISSTPSFNKSSK